MRKSEAEHLLEQIKKDYDGPLKLGIANLENLGFRVPEHEHPFFVVGLETKEEEGGIKKIKRSLKEKVEVVVWDDQSSGWKVQKVKSWQIQQERTSDGNLFIYDTRKREFVSPDSFKLPPRSS